jgi:hypothetical protein
MINAGSSRQRVVVYPISKAEEDRGGALINWVATLKTAATGDMPPLGSDMDPARAAPATSRYYALSTVVECR